MDNDKHLVEDEKNNSKKRGCSYWSVLFAILFACLGKCVSSEIKKNALEENAEKYRQENTRMTESLSSDDKSNMYVKEAVYSLMDRLPIEFPGIGKVKRISYYGEYVIFEISIKEDASYGLLVEKINEKIELAEEVIMTCLGIQDEDIKNEIKVIAEQSCNLTIEIKGNSSQRIGFVHLSPDKLKRALTQSHFSSSEEASLGMTALTTRLMLPVQVNQVTTWIDTRLTKTSFMYVYNLDDKEIDWKYVDKGMMKEEQISILRQNKDVMGKVIRCCIITHRNLVYRYVGSSSKKNVDVTLTDKDLSNL